MTLQSASRKTKQNKTRAGKPSLVPSSHRVVRGGTPRHRARFRFPIANLCSCLSSSSTFRLAQQANDHRPSTAQKRVRSDRCVGALGFEKMGDQNVVISVHTARAGRGCCGAAGQTWASSTATAHVLSQRGITRSVPTKVSTRAGKRKAGKHAASI